MLDRNALTHERVWAAIDALAERHNLTTSGLARRAGLDPTTFNRSKRMAGDRPRWPSTESIAKILEATGARAEEFFALGTFSTSASMGGLEPAPVAFVPLAGIPGYPDGLFDAGGQRAEIPFPAPRDTAIYALEVVGDAMLPLYREADVLIVAPGAPVRRGDRVIVRTGDGRIHAMILHRRTGTSLELHPFDPAGEARVLPLDAVRTIDRILWASQ